MSAQRISSRHSSGSSRRYCVASSSPRADVLYSLFSHYSLLCLVISVGSIPIHSASFHFLLAIIQPPLVANIVHIVQTTIQPHKHRNYFIKIYRSLLAYQPSHPSTVCVNLCDIVCYALMLIVVVVGGVGVVSWCGVWWSSCETHSTAVFPTNSSLLTWVTNDRLKGRREEKRRR